MGLSLEPNLGSNWQTVQFQIHIGSNLAYESLMLQVVAQNQLGINIFMFNSGGDRLDTML